MKRTNVLSICTALVLAACGSGEERSDPLTPPNSYGGVDAFQQQVLRDAKEDTDTQIVPDAKAFGYDTGSVPIPDVSADSTVVAEVQPVPDIPAADTAVQDVSVERSDAPITSPDLVTVTDAPVVQPDAYVAETQIPTIDASPAIDAGIDTGTTVTSLSLTDFTFSTWTTSSGSVSTMTISSDRMSVVWHGQSGSDGEAGLNATLANPADLTGYDRIWFDATIPEGQITTVGIYKTNNDYCKWKVVGAGKRRYTVDMTSGAVYCGQTVCGVSRDSVTSVYFDTGWWGTQFVTEMTLTNLGVASTKAGASPLSHAEGASFGLNGWCWWLWSVVDAVPGTATSSWVETPSDIQSHFSVADTATKGMAGVVVYLPDSLKDLSGYSYLVMNSAVQLSGGFTKFTVSLMSSTGASCLWDASSLGPEYLLQLGSYDYCAQGGDVPFDIKDVRAVRITSDYNQMGTADFDVSMISFQGIK